MQKIIAISGPTASGKTGLSIELAKKFNGEIICADSRTVYSGMDIGTAKVTKKEMGGIVHHGLDLVNPSERYSVGEFKLFCEEKIEEIVGRGKTPILVGGTGLYISSVLENYGFDGENGPKKYDSLLLVMDVEREVLYERINHRVDTMIKEGLIEEVKGLLEKFDATMPGMTGIGYRQIVEYLKEEKTLEEAAVDLKQASRNYAKRQITWWRHHGEPIYVKSVSDASEQAEKFLNI